MRETPIAAVRQNVRQRVYDTIRKVGPTGVTLDELEVHFGFRLQTACGRVNELCKDSLVIDSGRRRPTRAGRKAIVWIETERHGA